MVYVAVCNQPSILYCDVINTIENWHIFESNHAELSIEVQNFKICWLWFPSLNTFSSVILQLCLQFETTCNLLYYYRLTYRMAQNFYWSGFVRPVKVMIQNFCKNFPQVIHNVIMLFVYMFETDSCHFMSEFSGTDISIFHHPVSWFERQTTFLRWQLS